MQILERHEIDLVTSDFPVGFATVFVDTHQFIAYYNKDRNLTVAAREISDTQWHYKILPTQVGWDAHNYISMTIDENNCIHLSGNMHCVPLIYFKTQKPYDIHSFEPVFTMVSSEDEQRCTYPRFMKDPEGHLLYAYRKGGSGNGILIVNRYDAETKSFERLTDQPLFDGLNEMSAYQSGPALGPDGQYHVTWLWRDTPHCETNHDLSYATSSDLIHWKPLGGEEMEVPITPRTKQFTVDPVPAKGGAINGASTLFYDSESNPLIAYMKYDTDGISQIYIARAESEKWNIAQVSQWDYRWEFSGSGSITFDIRIQRAKFTSSGHIVIPYWHAKRGHGELHVDGDSLARIEDRILEDRKAFPYPDELLQLTSPIEGMSVQWQSINSPNTSPNESYALRWETLGKRRFHEPVEVPVEPTALMLYKLSTK